MNPDQEEQNEQIELRFRGIERKEEEGKGIHMLLIRIFKSSDKTALTFEVAKIAGMRGRPSTHGYGS